MHFVWVMLSCVGVVGVDEGDLDTTSDATKDLVQDVYDAHVEGQELWTYDKRNALKEKSEYQNTQSANQLDVFIDALSDDLLDDQEREDLARLGISSDALSSHDWQYAWTHSVLGSFDDWWSPNEEEECAIIQEILTDVDLSQLSEDDKWKIAQVLEVNVMAEYMDKPKSTALAIDLYAKIEPDGRTVPEVFFEILLFNPESGDIHGLSYNETTNLQGCIFNWVKQTQNPSVSRDFVAFGQRIFQDVTEFDHDEREAFYLKNSLIKPTDIMFYAVGPDHLADMIVAADGNPYVHMRPDDRLRDLKKYDPQKYYVVLEHLSGKVLIDAEHTMELAWHRESKTITPYLKAAGGEGAPLPPPWQDAESAEELKLWLGVLAKLSPEEFSVIPKADTALLKAKLLQDPEKFSECKGEVGALVVAKPDFFDQEDFPDLIPMFDSLSQGGALHDQIVRWAKASDSKEAVEVLARVYVQSGYGEGDLEQLKKKADQTQVYVSSFLLSKFSEEDPKAKPYFLWLAAEHRDETLEVYRGLTDVERRKDLMYIMLVSGHTDFYRGRLAQMPLSEEERDILTDPVTGVELHLPEYLRGWLVEIPGGTFTMGNDHAAPDEAPAHRVQVKTFYAAKYEVTEKIWNLVMSENRLYRSAPVNEVTWSEAKSFCQKINAMLPETSEYEVGLPTEAEWEYMARGKSHRDAMATDTGHSYITCDQANFDGCGDGSRNDVGKYEPNSFGVYDLSGNVWEWTADCYTERYDPSGSQSSCSDNSDRVRVVRGGSYLSDSQNLRASSRLGWNKGAAKKEIGFRFVVRLKDS